MAHQTGENEQALRKILDMTRLISIVILAIHFYYACYTAFKNWELVSPFSDKILSNIIKTGLLTDFNKPKLIALGFLIISLIGARGKKDQKLNHKIAFTYIVCGLLIYFISYFSLFIGTDITIVAVVYILLTAIGYLLILSGGTLLSRIIKSSFNNNDIFNSEAETFPQEERLLENELSINLPARYRLKNKFRDSWINIISPVRATIVSGSPGAGKSAFVIRHFITQALAKSDPYTLFVYDFKFPDLSLIAYNHWLKNKHRYKGKPECIFINFDDLSRSHRGNVFDPLGMTDITDATESARTILLGLNREWQKKTGEFFVESAINFVTAVIWFLRKYQDGLFCTLPHVIELIQLPYDALFTLLRTEKEIEVLINPFVNAYLNDVMEQLEGQIASAKIALARLASPQLYYVLSGNDFSIDLNNPENPKVICMGNNPQKIQTYGAVLSLYVNRMLKVVNQKNKLKSMLVFDEFPTLTTDIIPTIVTGRSNLISVCLGIQDASQLRKDYGREQADVITNTVGNIISGQVTGDSAKQLSERIGKIMQDRESLSINSGDTSISKSKQLDYAVPASKIAALSSGQFVGMVADTPSQKIELKAFHCEIQNDFEAIQKEEKAYQDIPLIRQVNTNMVQQNYLHIKEDVQDIVNAEFERLLNDPALVHLIIRK
ncbi:MULTISPECIES: conjugal transfer protein MobC [unclassified Flavobacterium]|mgnify:CR=1 FL=1|uniref:conjugal transfer protein MobC n=1 Tax=unclassified Flavobacterium TaxID=196869 RepID=UPI000963F0E1|nr:MULTISPECIES: conjugal transfer protein MobC [unclassified Flavobacterium]MBN9284093.1 YWFCY domain-containing protein [Flavobacterium sp.]OJV71109.1 MAG: conjugal transfer protein TraG [Flavobacterium sp. 40-81]